MRENGIEESIDRPLTIALVVDTVGNQGNGTSNSALQWAAELERQGHHVRLVGIGAPEYPARVNMCRSSAGWPKKQQMQFAEPSDTLFRTAFDGVDVVLSICRSNSAVVPAKVAHQMGIRRYCRIPPAAGERAVFGRPSKYSRYLPLPVLAVQALAVQARLTTSMCPPK